MLGSPGWKVGTESKAFHATELYQEVSVLVTLISNEIERIPLMSLYRPKEAAGWQRTSRTGEPGKFKCSVKAFPRVRGWSKIPAEKS